MRTSAAPSPGAAVPVVERLEDKVLVAPVQQRESRPVRSRQLIRASRTRRRHDCRRIEVRDADEVADLVQEGAVETLRITPPLRRVVRNDDIRLDDPILAAGRTALAALAEDRPRVAGF